MWTRSVMRILGTSAVTAEGNAARFMEVGVKRGFQWQVASVLLQRVTFAIAMALSTLDVNMSLAANMT
jgi:hypothetical protein